MLQVARLLALLLCLALFPTRLSAAWAIDTAWAGSGIGGSGATNTCSIATINAGTFAVVVFRTATGVTHSSVADDEGQTWAQASTTLVNATDGDMSVWYKANHPGGTTVVVTLTLSGSVSGRNSACGTYSGIDTSTPFDVGEGRRQANPGTGTDAITTDDGSAPTVTSNGSLAIGAFWANNTAGTHSAGTNFTQRLNTNGAASGEWLIEDRSLDASASAIATATQTDGTIDYLTFVTVFDLPTVGGEQQLTIGSGICTGAGVC